jgi:hypothetical protein
MAGAKRNRHRGSAMLAEHMPEHYAASHGEGSKVTAIFPPCLLTIR